MIKDYDEDYMTVKELKNILANHKDDAKVILTLDVTHSGDASLSIEDTQENILFASVFNP